MTQAIHEPGHPTAACRLALWFTRPKVMAIGCLVLLAGLGWVCLGLMLAGPGPTGPQLPRANRPMLDMLADRMGLGWGRAAIEALCWPTFGTADAGAGAVGVAAMVLMWGAMAATFGSVCVKVFGCRPPRTVRHTPLVGVRKPPGEKTAGRSKWGSAVRLAVGIWPWLQHRIAAPMVSASTPCTTETSANFRPGGER